jgi:hypothetical protein
MLFFIWIFMLIAEENGQKMKIGRTNKGNVATMSRFIGGRWSVTGVWGAFGCLALDGASDDRQADFVGFEYWVHPVW